MTEPTTPPLFRYVDEDDFHLSAHLLLDRAPATLSITIEGSDEPQSAHVPVGELPRVLAGIAAAAGLSAPVAAPTTAPPVYAPCTVHGGDCRTEAWPAPPAPPVDTDPRDRRDRWEAAAWAAGRTVDRNALAAYMAVADTEQAALRAEVEGLDEALRGAISVSEKDGARLRAELEQLRTDRATVLREAVEVAGQMGGRFGTDDHGDLDTGWNDACEAISTELRRLADEAQQPETEAARGCGCGTYMRCPNGHCTRHYTCQDCGRCCTCGCSGQPTPAPSEEPTP
ncbi:hypothetical protein ABZ438_07845 [Streptomyces sp. NPDC005786]|uniref:hypothetical protein n=1 Tax=Streptomyces sp. NPDC005786 TaxID=3154891 RepID=UPI0034050022